MRFLWKCHGQWSNLWFRDMYSKVLVKYHALPNINLLVLPGCLLLRTSYFSYKLLANDGCPVNKMLNPGLQLRICNI